MTTMAEIRQHGPVRGQPALQPSGQHLAALSRLPTGLFLMTASYDGKRVGVIVNSVQPCSQEPPLICITMRKGNGIEPLIRDSRCFAVCMMDPSDKLLHKKFGSTTRPRESGDPFDCLPLERLVTGAPVVKRAIAAFDCEVVRHIDIEAEYEIYIGLVVASREYATK